MRCAGRVSSGASGEDAGAIARGGHHPVTDRAAVSAQEGRRKPLVGAVDGNAGGSGQAELGGGLATGERRKVGKVAGSG
jgi:hypothetical protein